MGDERKTVAVADAGPLIHLHEVSGLDMLRMFTSVYIPNAVWDESVHSDRVSEIELSSKASIIRQSVSKEEVSASIAAVSSKLHRGELECLALSRRLDIPILLTDDLAARSAAAALGIQPVGSLGIVIRACHQRRITLAQAGDYLEKLHYISSLFVTRTIIDLAFEQLRRST